MMNSAMNGQDDNRIGDNVVDDMVADIFAGIGEEIAATANAAARNAQHSGTANPALQLDGRVAASQQNNTIDPWLNQTLPQRTFDNATVSPEVAWQRYRPGVASSTSPQDIYQYNQQS